MQLHDFSQNLSARIGTIQIFGFILLAILGVRFIPFTNKQRVRVSKKSSESKNSCNQNSCSARGDF